MCIEGISCATEGLLSISGGRVLLSEPRRLVEEGGSPDEGAIGKEEEDSVEGVTVVKVGGEVHDLCDVRRKRWKWW